MTYPYQLKSFEQYKDAYQKSLDSPETFWAEIAEHFVWKKKWVNVLEWNFIEILKYLILNYFRFTKSSAKKTIYQQLKKIRI